jgi:hypothetical protein
VTAATRPPAIPTLATAIAALTIATTTTPAASPADWKTYRSERFGYELSYPPDMKLKVYFGGVSGELRTAAGAELLELDVWPGDLCPREAPGTTAKALGLERAEMITQADGDGSSSACGRPITMRESVSSHGVRLFELELSCRAEHTEGRRVVRERLGKKGPTFFADVSQPWRSRVLMVDPVGVDPRMGPRRPAAGAELVRQILETLTTFPLPDPHVVCIDDFGSQPAGVLAVPTSPAR